MSQIYIIHLIFESALNLFPLKATYFFYLEKCSPKRKMSKVYIFL